MRFYQHKRNTRGWPQYADLARFRIEWYPSKEEAEQAERLAIERERPPYNVKDNPDQDKQIYSSARVELQIRGTIDRLKVEGDRDGNRLSFLHYLIGSLIQIRATEATLTAPDSKPTDRDWKRLAVSQ